MWRVVRGSRALGTVVSARCGASHVSTVSSSAISTAHPLSSLFVARAAASSSSSPPPSSPSTPSDGNGTAQRNAVDTAASASSTNAAAKGPAKESMPSRSAVGTRFGGYGVCGTRGGAETAAAEKNMPPSVSAKPSTATAAAHAAATAAAVATSPAETAVHYLRKSRSPPSSRSGGEGAGEKQVGVNEEDGGGGSLHRDPRPVDPEEYARRVKLGPRDELLQAYNRFAHSVDGCGDAELLTGAQQAYYSTAVLIGALAEHSKPVQGKLEIHKTDAAAAEARKVLAKEFLPEKEWKSTLLTRMRKSVSVDVDTADNDHSKTPNIMMALEGITSIVPMAEPLAARIFYAWCKQKEKKANVFAIASPSDYVLSSDMAMFVRLDEYKVYLSDNTDFTITVVFPKDKLETAQAKEAEEADMALRAAEVSATEASSVKTSSTASPSQATVTAEEVDSSQLNAAAADLAANHDVGFLLKLNEQSLNPIPGSALACAVLTMDVVVPPERYATNFEWFYNRIVGYDSEYERIAAARIFATSSPRWLARSMDFIMRMFTGKPVEFMFSKSIRSMIGIPENVAECPPATRKVVSMYLDRSRRWILSDIVPVSPVIAAKVPSA